jgi:hypothetical protein
MMQADKHGVSGVFRLDKWADHKLSRSAIRNASRVRLRAALMIQRGSGRLSRQPDWWFAESLFHVPAACQQSATSAKPRSLGFRALYPSPIAA